MAGNIFFVNENEQIIPLKEAKYESEDLFQRLIEQYPDILAGDQITPDQPRKWIFISREMGIPEHESGGAQWFLDHLFIDQDAIPTLVEVKRSTDTRIRREVVAQMLDYAANASAYWPVNELREVYETRCREQGTDPLEKLGLSPADADTFWTSVHSNLRLGKLRLLFVADEIPDSLRRIIEFLNGQMADTEVLGLEIRQFISEQNHRTLVPRIIGRTPSAVQVKSQANFAWNEDSYLERVEQISGSQTADVCRRLLQEFRRLGCWIYWGGGQKQAGFVPIFEGAQKHQLGAIYAYDKHISIEIYFQHFKPPFNQKERQIELMRRFNEIPGVNIPSAKIFKRPSFDCSLLIKENCFRQYIKIYEDMLDEIRRFEAQNV